MTYYRISALASALARMWRGWAVIVPVVVANAALQALLIWPDPTPGANALAIVIAFLSAVVFLAAYSLVGAAALRVADGGVSWSQAVGVVRENGTRYAVSAFALTVVVVIGLAVYTVPGLLVIALTPFLLLAALDGKRNPLAANFATIGRRFGRWLLTIVITGLVVVVGWPMTGLFAFFIRGSLASFVVWTVSGLVVAWFTTAWALIYRSVAAREQATTSPVVPQGLSPLT